MDFFEKIREDDSFDVDTDADQETEEVDEKEEKQELNEDFGEKYYAEAETDIDTNADINAEEDTNVEEQAKEDTYQNIADEITMVETTAVTNSTIVNTLFGFIITRHVNSESTNRYWNQNVKLLRSFYPYAKIVIIDDNSNSRFVKADFNYKNVQIVQSEYPGRGELLPYIYYARNKWFERAVIIHDSVFIHKRIPFGAIKAPVIPIWHFKSDKLHYDAAVKIARKLNYSDMLIRNLSRKRWNGCFGVQSVVKHTFAEHIVNKYNLDNAISVVKCRDDRCALERIFGIIFCLECPGLYERASLFGTIFAYSFGYNYDEYYEKLTKERKTIKPIVKVWTGR